MSKNILHSYLKKYNIKRLAQITGIEVEILELVKINKVPEHITQLKNGKYVPSINVLKSQIINKIKENEKRRLNA